MLPRVFTCPPIDSTLRNLVTGLWSALDRSLESHRRHKVESGIFETEEKEETEKHKERFKHQDLALVTGSHHL